MTPAGPATLHFEVRSSDVSARAWGPGADWSLEHAPELVGAHDDFDFEPKHRVLRELSLRKPGLRVGGSRAVVEIMVPTILEQKITTIEAKRSLHRLVRKYGRPAPGPGALMIPPASDVLASLPYYELHPLGIERRRAELVRAVCRRAARLETLAERSPEDAGAVLRSLPGIGPWTASHVLRVALGDPDAVIVGDYHFPSTVSWALAREPRADDARMLELLEPYRGQRGRAQQLIVWGSPRAPRRGPKRPLRSLARI
jgi:3-methyladenine DNA glycosylase/8-oxoguanine DNA glycosylase